jgi:hypothetical protein
MLDIIDAAHGFSWSDWVFGVLLCLILAYVAIFSGPPRGGPTNDMRRKP